MTGAEWTALVVAAIGAMGTVLLQALQMWLSHNKSKAIEKKTEQVSAKVDQNTAITQAGVKKTDSAVIKIDQANKSATEAKEAAIAVNKKLNGGVDDAVTSALAPLHKKIEEHAQTDERNMTDIDKKFEALTEYVHKRNHDLLDAVGAVANKVNALIEMQKK